jgi:hypothetical protein
MVGRCRWRAQVELGIVRQRKILGDLAALVAVTAGWRITATSRITWCQPLRDLRNAVLHDGPRRGRRNRTRSRVAHVLREVSSPLTRCPPPITPHRTAAAGRPHRGHFTGWFWRMSDHYWTLLETGANRAFV